MINNITLTNLKEHQTGIVTEITGGSGLKRRLESLGIRAGNNITKISKGFMHGPVTVKVCNTLISLGHGMASKVLVSVEE